MKRLNDLMVGILKENPLMESSHRIIDEYFVRNVTKFTEQLESIRTITQETPQEIVDDSIRQIGFDIPSWVMRTNGENIRRCFYHLTQVYQINGTPNYPKFLEFLLDRGLRVVNLYTQDYVEFFPQPLGRLVSEGGSWFLTTHVDLEIMANGIIGHYPLELTEQDIVWIKANLNYDTAEQWQKDDIDFDINRMVSAGTVYGVNDAVYAYMVLDKRIIDLFYQFAPIEEVVRGIYMTITAQANLYITGSLVEEQIDFIELNGPYPVQTVLELNSMLSAGQEYAVYGRVVWSNGMQTPESAVITWADHGYTITEENKIVFNEVEAQLRKDVIVEYRILGVVETTRITLYQGDVELVPSALVIKGPNVVTENNTVAFNVIGDFRGPQGDAKFREIYDVENVKLTTTSPDVTIDKFNLTVNRIFEDKNIVIQAEYETSEGTKLYQSFPMLLRALPKPIIPIGVEFAFNQIIYNSEGLIVNETPHTGDLLQNNFYRIKTTLVYSDNSLVPTDMEVNCSSLAIVVEADRTFHATVVNSDYENIFSVKYTEGDEVVVASVSKLVVFPKIVLNSLEIVGPDVLMEGKTERYSVLAHWSNGQVSSVPEAQLVSREALLGAEMLYPVTIDRGSVTAPVLGTTARSQLTASVQRYTDGHWIEVTKLLTIKNNDRIASSIATIMADQVTEGNRIAISFFVTWTDGKVTQVMPTAVRLIKQDNGVIHSEAVRVDPSVDTEIVETGFGPLRIKMQPTQTFTETETGLECRSLMIEYEESDTSLNGLFSMEFDYDDPYSANLISANRLFTTAEKFVGSESVTILVPNEMSEGSRHFAKAVVRFENGTDKEVEANWSVEDIEGEMEDVGADVSVNTYTLQKIVYSLIALDETELMDMALTTQDLTAFQIRNLINGESIFAEMSNQPIPGQTWPQKLLILFAQYPEPLPRCLIQTRFIAEDELFVLRCGFFAKQDARTIKIVNRPVEPDTPILSWYITGPVEIEANLYNFYSYGLSVQYADNGVEYLVSNDWEVELYSDENFDQRRELIRTIVLRDGDGILPMDNDGSGRKKDVDELTAEELLEVLPTSSVVDIDQNGYLYPRLNENARIFITAVYNDGQQQFREELPIYIRKQNTRLQKIEVALVGPTGSITFDFKDKLLDEPNAWSNLSLDGVVYYQFRAYLTRFGDPAQYELVENLFWKAEPVGSGVSFDEQSGRLYILQQSNDSDVTIVASYEEEFRESETSSTVFLESIKSYSLVKITATKALDVIDILGSTFTTSDTTFYPSYQVIRRDGSLASVDVVSLSIVEAPLDISISIDGKGIVIPKRSQDIIIKVRATAVEGLRTIYKDFTVTILASFVPLELHINSNPAGIRDNGEFYLKAFLEMRDGSTYDATTDSYWLLETKLTGLELGNRTGLLKVPYVDRDTEITFKVVYTRNEIVFEKTHTMIIQSSYPMYWEDPVAAINATYFQNVIAGEEFKRLLSTTGGRFTSYPAAAEYLYFAHPKNFGSATFAIIPSTTGAINWGNMQAPVEVTRTYINGVTEPWLIYRTVNRGFTLGEFSVVYGQ